MVWALWMSKVVMTMILHEEIDETQARHYTLRL